MTQPIIDAKVFNELKATMGADFIGELIDAFCDDTAVLIAQIERALAEGNVDIFRRSAHSIKSNSASYGALAFSAQAQELEAIAKLGDIRGTEQKVASLVAEYPRVVQRLRELQHGV